MYPIVDGQANCISLYIEETMLAINKDEIVDALVITSVLLTWRVDTVADIMFAIRRGVFLCDLIGLIFNTKLTGVVRQPLSDTTSLSNCRKALDVLKL